MNQNYIVMPLLREIACELDIDFIFEPTRQKYGVLCFHNGRKFYLRDVNLNLNASTSIGVTKNKALCCFFLNKFGYSTPDFTLADATDANSIIEARQFVQNWGYPVILKPNNLSQGRHVYKVNNEMEYCIYEKLIAEQTKVFQIQEYCPGNDYRVVILGNELLCAYQRIPFHVIGDGILTIKDLISKKQELFVRNGRDTIIDVDDIRIQKKLSEQTLLFDSILNDGELLYLQDVSNLCLGGETQEITSSIHPTYIELSKCIARDLNLELCGIDIMCNNINMPIDAYKILEVNSAPGLDNYAYSGTEQVQYVKHLYTKILKYLKGKYE